MAGYGIPRAPDAAGPEWVGSWWISRTDFFFGLGMLSRKKQGYAQKSLSYSSCLKKQSWNLRKHNHLSLSKKMPPWSPVALFVQHEEGASTSIPWTWVKWPSFKSGALSTMSWWRMGPHLKKNTQFQGIWGRGFLDGVQVFFFRCPCCCVSIVSFELFIDISGSGQVFWVASHVVSRKHMSHMSFFSDGDWNQANLNGISFFGNLWVCKQSIDIVGCSPSFYNEDKQGRWLISQCTEVWFLKFLPYWTVWQSILNSLAVSLTPPQAAEFLNVLPSINAKLPEEIRIRRSVLQYQVILCDLDEGCLIDPFKGYISDLQLGNQKITINQSPG